MTSSILARLLERPERALWALIAAQIAFWSLAPALSHSAPPLDVTDQYATGREWVVAIFKHPNFPGLVQEAVRVLTGIAGWPTYVVSQIFVVTTFAAVYALGKDLMDAQRALVGTALLAGVYFFSWPTPEFNHNVAQMPFWALTSLALWRATNRQGIWWWVVLGLAAGASMWAKYSSAILLVVAGTWMLWDGEARKRLLTPGPWITAIVAAAVFAPQLLWLIDHDFQPMTYAARRSSTVAFTDTLTFLPAQLVYHAPMFVLMLCAGLFGRAAEQPAPPPERRALNFLLLMGLGPAIILTGIGLVSMSGLRTAWAAPMFNLSGLIAVALLSTRIDPRRVKATFMGAGLTLALISGLYFAHMRYGYEITGKPLRGNWPQTEISETLKRAWAEQTNGAPLHIIAGDTWNATLVTMSDGAPPHILINGDFSISPWLQPNDLARHGALVVWSDRVPDTLAPLIANRPQHDLEFRPPNASTRVRSIVMHYVIIAPGGPANALPDAPSVVSEPR